MSINIYTRMIEGGKENLVFDQNYVLVNILKSSFLPYYIFVKKNI